MPTRLASSIKVSSTSLVRMTQASGLQLCSHGMMPSVCATFLSDRREHDAHRFQQCVLCAASCSCFSASDRDLFAAAGALLRASLRPTAQLAIVPPASRMLTGPLSHAHCFIVSTQRQFCTAFGALLYCCPSGLAVLLDTWRWTCRQDSGAADGAGAAAGDTTTQETPQHRYTYRYIPTPFSKSTCDLLSVCLSQPQWLADLSASNVSNSAQRV